MLSVPDPRYYGYYGYTNDFVEVKGPNGWGLLCSGVLNAKSASVVCKENKNLFNHGMRVGNHDSYNGTRYTGIISCKAEDEKMDNCVKFFVKVDECSEGEVMVDCTPS